ncbi:MAG: OmpH family outer membrane protein [Bacteroidota bacterium]
MNRLKIFKSIILFFLISFVADAQQKIAFVVSESIIKELTEAQEAQKQIEAISQDWQNELKKMQDELNKQFDEYDRRKLMMSDRKRSEEEKLLQEFDAKMVDYRQKKFGTNGELFQKQNEMMKPIQEKILKAIKDVSTQLEYDYVLDRSSSTLLMYSNEKHDITQKVLEKLQQK